MQSPSFSWDLLEGPCWRQEALGQGLSCLCAVQEYKNERVVALLSLLFPKRGLVRWSR